MNKTTNYNLSQWEPEDKVLRTDFNADNARIDAALGELASGKGNCQVVFGQYAGDGTYGTSHKTTMRFDRKLLLLLISSSGVTMMAARNSQYGFLITRGTSSSTNLTWDENSVSMYSTENAGNQMNEKGYTYYYVAFLEQ